MFQNNMKEYRFHCQVFDAVKCGKVEFISLKFTVLLGKESQFM